MTYAADETDAPSVLVPQPESGSKCCLTTRALLGRRPNERSQMLVLGKWMRYLRGLLTNKTPLVCKRMYAKGPTQYCHCDAICSSHRNMRQEYLILVSIIGLMRGLLLIGIGAIWLLSFICLLRRIVASFLPEFHKKICHVFC